MKIIAISDTHNKHSQLIIPECDILIHSGDFSGLGRLGECKTFLEWFSTQPAKHKIFICGNHDGTIPQDQSNLWEEILKEYPDVTYLQNSGVEIDGIKIWGRPITPSYGGWYWMADRESPKMTSSFEIIPNDIDILVTHGPPYQILDKNMQNEHCGCKDMLHWLMNHDSPPKLIVCGHIHHSTGSYLYSDNTLIINASVLNDHYEHYKSPFEIDFDGKSAKVLK